MQSEEARAMRKKNTYKILSGNPTKRWWRGNTRCRWYILK